MASITMMVGGALTNALAFSGSSFLFSQMSGDQERKRHNLATERLQHDRDKWNEARLKNIDYINQKLADEGHAHRTFQSVDQAMQEYYLLTGDPLPAGFGEMPPEPQIEDYLDEDQQKSLQMGELAIIGAGMLLTGYLTYRYI
jgi:hypothetical protein